MHIYIYIYLIDKIYHKLNRFVLVDMSKVRCSGWGIFRHASQPLRHGVAGCAYHFSWKNTIGFESTDYELVYVGN